MSTTSKTAARGIARRSKAPAGAATRTKGRPAPTMSPQAQKLAEVFGDGRWFTWKDVQPVIGYDIAVISRTWNELRACGRGDGELSKGLPCRLVEPVIAHE